MGSIPSLVIILTLKFMSVLLQSLYFFDFLFFLVRFILLYLNIFLSLFFILIIRNLFLCSFLNLERDRERNKFRMFFNQIFDLSLLEELNIIRFQG